MELVTVPNGDVLSASKLEKTVVSGIQVTIYSLKYCITINVIPVGHDHPVLGFNRDLRLHHDGLTGGQD